MLDLKFFIRETMGLNSGVPCYLVYKGGQSLDSVCLGRVDPALNEYLEKSGEGKQEGYTKAKDGWPQAPLPFLG